MFSHALRRETVHISSPPEIISTGQDIQCDYWFFTKADKIESLINYLANGDAEQPEQTGTICKIRACENLDTFSFALKYTTLGCAVLPLHTINSDGTCSCSRANCSSPGKHPRTVKGVSEASKDLEQIKKWWSLWPDSNIGIATDLLSGIVVLDIDNDDETGENGAESLLEWARGIGYDLPDTWKALSGGGGMHFIYRSSKEIRNRIKVLPGVDVRGDGGYIVAPPSLHVSGRRYEWEVSPDEMPEPIPLPLEIESLMSSQQSSGSFSFTVTVTVAEGARNTTMFKLASSLKAKGLSYEAILAAVSSENAQRCSPALEVRSRPINLQTREKDEIQSDDKEVAHI